MTKFIFKARRENYNRFGRVIPYIETVCTSLSEYFNLSRTDKEILEAFKKDGNIDIRVKEDSISSNSVIEKPYQRPEIVEEKPKRVYKKGN